MAEQLLKRAQVGAAASRCVAKLWRSACGVSVSGRPRRRRAAATARRTRSGLSGPPLAPTNSGHRSTQRIRALPRHSPSIASRTAGTTGTIRVFDRLPVTLSVEPIGSTSAVSDNASATRRPAP